MDFKVFRETLISFIFIYFYKVNLSLFAIEHIYCLIGLGQIYVITQQLKGWEKGLIFNKNIYPFSGG